MPVSAIDHHTTDYGLAQAYWLAQAAALAYEESNVIEAEAQRWGFERVRHHQTQFQPPFPLEDTQAYTMASDHMIRGRRSRYCPPSSAKPIASFPSVPACWSLSSPAQRSPSSSQNPIHSGISPRHPDRKNPAKRS
jgi:hypothetical protein